MHNSGLHLDPPFNSVIDSTKGRPNLGIPQYRSSDTFSEILRKRIYLIY